MNKKKEAKNEAKKNSQVKIKDLKLRKQGEGIKGGAVTFGREKLKGLG